MQSIAKMAPMTLGDSDDEYCPGYNGDSECMNRAVVTFEIAKQLCNIDICGWLDDESITDAFSCDDLLKAL